MMEIQGKINTAVCYAKVMNPERLRRTRLVKVSEVKK